MKIYRLSRQKAFHGSKSKIEAFSIGFVGDGHDADGPGIYFTSDLEDALWYGDNVYEVELNFNKWLEAKGSINWGEVKQMMLWGCGVESYDELEEMSEEQFYDTNLSDWAEEPSVAFDMVYDSIKNSSTDPFDAFLNVWINMYRYREKEFLQNMVKLGYDGAITFNKNNSGVNHYVVYNVNIIKIDNKLH